MSRPPTLRLLRWSTLLYACLGCASGAPEQLDAGPEARPTPRDAAQAAMDAAALADSSTPAPRDAGGIGDADRPTAPTDEDAGTDPARCDDDPMACARPDPSCAPIRLRHAAHVYYVCPSARTWQAARDACRADPRFDLIRIDDAAEQRFFETSVTSLTSDVWINATDTMTPDRWAWMDDGDVFWTGTSTGSAAAGLYNDWAEGEPSGNGDCARHAIIDGVWRDSHCDEELHFFVCESVAP